jgi:hypothetical protein
LFRGEGLANTIGSGGRGNLVNLVESEPVSR